MDKIKKEIKQIVTTGTTGNGDIIEVPDETVSYNFKILLTKREKDWGFFDYVESD